MSSRTVVSCHPFLFALAASSLALLLLSSPVHAETIAEVALEVAAEVPVELGSTDGGVDVPDGGIEAGIEAGVDGPTPDTAPPSDGPRDTVTVDSGGGIDMAVSADAIRRDGGTQDTDDGDCGCRVGGAGRRTSGALSLFGAVAGVLLVTRQIRRRPRRAR